MFSVMRNGLSTKINSMVRLFQTTSARNVDRHDYRRVPKADEGVQGEKIVNLDAILEQKQNIFPTADSDNLIFDGKKYKDLPICNIRVSKNNTIVSLTDSLGTTKLIRSCGMEGFKNTKKGTNIAAQTTAIALAMKVLDKGIKTVRVRVRGLGPGRLAAVKGLQMGGLNIVSVTDNTPVSDNPPRARKARRI